MKYSILFMCLLFSKITYSQFNTASYRKVLTNIELASPTNTDRSFVDYTNLNQKQTPIIENKNIIPIEEQKKVAFLKLEPIEIEEEDHTQLVYMPLDNMHIISNYGVRFHPIDKVYKPHNGIDLKANNSFVYAVLDGLITEAYYTKSNGNYLVIRHQDFETIYLHLDEFYYTKGEEIKAGDIIATTGTTGKSTGEHLHFAVKENGIFINPIDFLNSLILTNNTIIDYGTN